MRRQRANEDFARGDLSSVGSGKPSRHAPSSLPDGGGNGDAGMVALSLIMSGVLFYGGLGWLVARWLGQPWIVAVGLVVGMATSTYLIIKRFGSGW